MCLISCHWSWPEGFCWACITRLRITIFLPTVSSLDLLVLLSGLIVNLFYLHAVPVQCCNCSAIRVFAILWAGVQAMCVSHSADVNAKLCKYNCRKIVLCNSILGIKVVTHNPQGQMPYFVICHPLFLFWPAYCKCFLSIRSTTSSLHFV